MPAGGYRIRGRLGGALGLSARRRRAQARARRYAEGEPSLKEFLEIESR
jgi:hypothetical protein